AQRQAGQHLAADHAGSDAVAAPPDAVQDVLAAAEVPEDRDAVRGAVDRTAPVVLDRDVGELRVGAAELGGDHRAAPGAAIEVRRDPGPVRQPGRALPEGDPAVSGGAVVVDHHLRVGDPLAAVPADLAQPPGDRSGGD